MEKDLLLCYIVDASGHLYIDKETFMPSVAKMQNGKVTDFMYDSFIFLSQPNYLYNYTADGAYRKPMTMADWQAYLTDEEFAAGYNIDALNAAVGEAKAALGNTDYKANVFMTLMYPVSDVTNFGTVDGKNLDFSNMQDRMAGIKWLVDTSLAMFNSRGYEHIRPAGFYWFTEDLSFSDGNEPLLRFTTDYVRSLGRKTCWCPYFLACGYDRWQDMGFDIAAHQANFFPEHKKMWPNRGTAERLPAVAEISKKTGIGVGMEMSDSLPASAHVFKQYLKAGAETGFMHKPHIYYIGTGPKTLKAVFESKDEYVKSVYGELHKFINRTLKPEEINLKEDTGVIL